MLTRIIKVCVALKGIALNRIIQICVALRSFVSYHIIWYSVASGIRCCITLYCTMWH